MSASGIIALAPEARRAACRSSVSKRSRMRKKKTPKTMKATSTEKATLDLDHQRHARTPTAARIRPFSSDMKPTTWVTALRRVIIIEQAEQHDRERQRQVLARQRRPGARSPAAPAGSTAPPGRRRSAWSRPTPSTVSTARWICRRWIDAVQRHRNDDRLEDERDGRGDVEMRRVLHEGLPGRRGRQHGRLQREDVEQRRTMRSLVEQHEADQHAGRRPADARCRSRAADASRGSVDTNRKHRRRAGQQQGARPGTRGTRKTRILAIDGLEHREQHAADGHLARAQAAAPSAKRAGPAAGTGDAPGHEDRRRSARRRAAASAPPPTSIRARCRPEYSSTIASCTMVSSRCVAGLSTGMRRVLGDRHHHAGRSAPGRARRAGRRRLPA